MTLVQALSEINDPFEVIHWVGTRTTSEALKQCPNPSWNRWLRNADLYKFTHEEPSSGDIDKTWEK
jgi:hypothetical protein